MKKLRLEHGFSIGFGVLALLGLWNAFTSPSIGQALVNAVQVGACGFMTWAFWKGASE